MQKCKRAFLATLLLLPITATAAMSSPETQTTSQPTQSITEKNPMDTQSYLEKNKQKPSVVTLPSGLQYEIVKTGSGTPPGPTDLATVHYKGTLTDGSEFDSSYSRGTPVEVIVCEKLQIKNMVKRPKAKQDPTTGKWLVNGASRKAGLNKSILNVAWGQLLQYTKYKLRERDKALVFVPAHYSSQECMACGHIAKENRLSQEHFSCIHCGHSDNADHNAACVLKKRFLTDLNTGTFVLPTKTVKRIAIRQKAARVAVSVCGAAVSPALAVGVG